MALSAFLLIAAVNGYSMASLSASGSIGTGSSGIKSSASSYAYKSDKDVDDYE